MVKIAENGLKGKTEVTKLSLENNGIGNLGLQALSLSLMDCKKLQELYLYNNELDDDPLDEFVAFLRQQEDLVAIGLEFNRIGYKGAAIILHALTGLSKLEKVYLNQNDINAQGGDSLFNFVSQVKNLKELRISNNHLEDSAG